MAFDPDAYLASDEKKKPFDPDEYLSSSTEDVPRGAISNTAAFDKKLQDLGVDTQAPEDSYNPAEHPTAERAAKLAIQYGNTSLFPKEINPIYGMGKEAELASNLLPEGRVKDVAQATAGGIEGLGEAASGLVTPVNAAMAVALPEGKLVQVLIAGYFEGQAIKGTSEQWQALKEAPDITTKARIAVGMGLNLALPAAGALHIAGSGKNAVVEPTEAGRATPEAAVKQSQGPVSGPQANAPSSVDSLRRPETTTGTPTNAPRSFSEVSPLPPSGIGEQIPVQSDLTRPNAMAAQQRGQAESPTAETPTSQGQPPEETGIAPGIEAAIAEIQRRNAPSEPVDGVPQTGQSQVPQNSALNPRESTGLSTTDNSVPTTGIAQRIHEQRMPGEVVPGEGLSAEALVDNGRKLISQGVDPNEIASMVLKDKRANADDVSVIRAKVDELSKATNKANDEWIADPDSPKARMAYDAAWQEEKRWRADILKPAQTEWSNVGRAMQGETAVDTGTFSGIRRAVLEDKGRDLKPEEIPKARKVVERVQKAQEAEARAKQAFDKAIERTAAKAPKSLEELKAHFAEKIRRLTPCE